MVMNFKQMQMPLDGVKPASLCDHSPNALSHQRWKKSADSAELLLQTLYLKKKKKLLLQKFSNMSCNTLKTFQEILSQNVHCCTHSKMIIQSLYDWKLTCIDERREYRTAALRAHTDTLINISGHQLQFATL